MTASLPLAVIGGGPAGALLATRLAQAGRAVTLVEERPGWEKPCGGGLTDKALRRYPFLGEAETDRNWVGECELRSPAGRCVRLQLDRKVAIFSRRGLNAVLLERARAAGASILADRVVGAQPGARGWQLALRGGGAIEAAAVCNASGARNPLAALPGPLAAGDWMATAGYYIAAARLPWPPGRMVIQFLPRLEGYIWSFPRADHASVGICGRLGETTTAELRSRLEGWLTGSGVEWDGSRFYAHLLPAPSPQSLAQARVASSDPLPWALLGDAAGLVDPITGEGLYYALRSADLLADALLARGPDATEAQPQNLSRAMAMYAEAVARELFPELTAAAAIAPRFYHGRFLGDSVLERMALFGERSSIFRQLLCDLFSGAQGYVDLRRRLYRNLAPSLLQLAFALPHPASESAGWPGRSYDQP